MWVSVWWWLGCTTTVEALPRERAPTEHWLAMGLAMRALLGGAWEDQPQRATLTYSGRRWGEDSLTLSPPSVSAAGDTVVRLTSGGRVRFDETQRNEFRHSEATLTGTLQLGEHSWTVACVGHAEAEHGGASARWCLPVLASARVVEPKP